MAPTPAASAVETDADAAVPFELEAFDEGELEVEVDAGVATVPAEAPDSGVDVDSGTTAAAIEEPSASPTDEVPLGYEQFAPTLPPPGRPPGWGWHCFAWIHLDQFGDECFRSPQVCKKAADDFRRSMKTECGDYASAYCLRLGKGSREQVKCFRSEDVCYRFRDHLVRGSVPFSKCVEFR